MNPCEMSDAAIVDALGEFFNKGYRVETENDDRFWIIAPNGSAEIVTGHSLSFQDDEAPDFEDLSLERQQEEIDFEHICELVTRYRFRFGVVLTNERLAEESNE